MATVRPAPIEIQIDRIESRSDFPSYVKATWSLTGSAFEIHGTAAFAFDHEKTISQLQAEIKQHLQSVIDQL